MKPAPFCALQVGIHGTPLPRPGGYAKKCPDALLHVDVLCFMLLLPSFSNHFITPFKGAFALLSRAIMILMLLDASMHISHSIFQTIHKQASTVTPQRGGTTNCYVSWPQNWGHESEHYSVSPHPGGNTDLFCLHAQKWLHVGSSTAHRLLLRWP